MNTFAHRKITHIVVHTAGAADKNGYPVDQSADTIRAYHKRKGWSDIGYHFVVRMNGAVEVGRPLRLIGAHVRGFNTGTIGICFTGHGDIQDFTDAQKKAGAELVAMLLEANGLKDTFLKNPMRVLGHAEVGKLRAILSKVFGHKIPDPHKSCPGKKVDMSEFRRAVIKELKG